MRAANLAPVTGRVRGPTPPPLGQHLRARVALITSCSALMAGCGARSASSASAHAPATCDLHDRVGERRAWLSTGTTPVALLDVNGDQLQVATLRDDVIITRWVGVHALAPVVTATTPVSPQLGEPADPSVAVLPGFRLPAIDSAWLGIQSGPPLAITGFVPSTTRGTFWDEPAIDPKAPTFATIRIELTIRAEPRRDAAVRGVIHPGARVRVLGSHSSGAPWIEVESVGDRVRVRGFVEPPPPIDRGNEAECCEYEVEGPPPPHGWLPIGTCLHDAPGGRIVGEVIGAVVDRPTPGANGWSSIAVTTAWGEARFHAHVPLLEPPPAPAPPAESEKAFEWPYRGEW